jgi:hypothetical protein
VDACEGCGESAARANGSFVKASLSIQADGPLRDVHYSISIRTRSDERDNVSVVDDDVKKKGTYCEGSDKKYHYWFHPVGLPTYPT